MRRAPRPAGAAGREQRRKRRRLGGVPAGLGLPAGAPVRGRRLLVAAAGVCGPSAATLDSSTHDPACPCPLPARAQPAALPLGYACSGARTCGACLLASQKIMLPSWPPAQAWQKRQRGRRRSEQLCCWQHSTEWGSPSMQPSIQHTAEAAQLQRQDTKFKKTARERHGAGPALPPRSAQHAQQAAPTHLTQRAPRVLGASWRASRRGCAP